VEERWDDYERGFNVECINVMDSWGWFDEGGEGIGDYVSDIVLEVKDKKEFKRGKKDGYEFCKELEEKDIRKIYLKVYGEEELEIVEDDIKEWEENR
jgi:hypothetical protein